MHEEKEKGKVRLVFRLVLPIVIVIDRLIKPNRVSPSPVIVPMMAHRW
jgi:hypothetical protein